MAGISTALTHAPRDREIVEVSRDRVRMICPNPEHAGGNERSGSFYVWTGGPRAGQGKCYGCGMTKSWGEIVRMLGLPREARFLGIEDVGDIVSDDEASRMLGVARARSTKSAMLRWPRDRYWRGISGQLVNAVGGRLVPSRQGAARLRLPVVMRGEEVGHVDCTLTSPPDGELGYKNSDGPWAQSALFPYDFVRARSPHVVVLVEGARDALTTIQNGAAALATLGSTNWSPRCAANLLATGASVFVIMADPDDAGDGLRRAAYAALSRRADVRSVELPSRIERHPTTGMLTKRKVLDPADLDRDMLTRALRRVGLVKREGSGWRPT